VTRPNALVGALAAAGVGTLLWLAWLIVAADLTVGTSIAAWGLWLLVLLTATTLVAYARELGRHRRVAGRTLSWRPLPGLVLLWVGGLTAVPVLALTLPHGQQPTAATAKRTSAALTTPEASPPTASGTQVPSPTSTSAPRPTRTQVARSADRTSPTTVQAPAPQATTTAAPRPPTTRPTTRPAPTTTTPLIDVTLLPNGHPKTKPPRP
jgi:hypothetical protein